GAPANLFLNLVTRRGRYVIRSRRQRLAERRRSPTLKQSLKRKLDLQPAGQPGKPAEVFLRIGEPSRPLAQADFVEDHVQQRVGILSQTRRAQQEVFGEEESSFPPAGALLVQHPVEIELV